MRPVDTRRVRLIGVPTTLYMHLQMHVDDLLRELELVDVGSESGLVVPAELGALPRARQDGRLPYLDEAWEQAVAAERAGRDRVDLDVALPRDAVGALDRLAELSERAEALSRAGLLLTAGASAAVRGLQRWIADEVRRQLGEHAEPMPYADP